LDKEPTVGSSWSRREFLGRTSAAGLAAGLAGAVGVPAVLLGSESRNEQIRLGCVGIRGRGQSHVDAFSGMAGVKVVALCDVDEKVLGTAAESLEKRTGRKIKRVVDYRKLVDDSNVDVVSIATPNHTHALIGIAAMAAGKDVYVEKPCSHNVWEGRQLAASARRYRRMCQHGTQGRSCPAIIEGIRKLREGIIGQLYMARGLCFKWRPSIGRTPDEPVPPGVHYDLWLGPAPLRPFSRNRFHYNWHWHWDYGNGDMGNQGVHEMDMARWGLGVGLPTRIHAAGGHFMFDDDQETPNTLVAIFEYPAEKKMLVFETRHWITNHEDFGSGSSNAVGVTFYGSEGYMQVYYFGYRTYLGQARTPGPKATGSSSEFETFIRGVRSRKVEDLGVEIEEGHLSSALCHLGNISYRLGRTLQFDPKTETFPSDAEANRLLTRPYRAPFVVPKIA
jgi:predicted dehydrogenase